MANAAYCGGAVFCIGRSFPQVRQVVNRRKGVLPQVAAIGVVKQCCEIGFGTFRAFFFLLDLFVTLQAASEGRISGVG